ncbi:MAG: hypothetical protein KF699_14875 [Phycisphaeraceae bacterium]|nr:hypothetical protein [Phycisphaeraceae bacterium]MBX3407400.1 hypothetical protein [Phycisphaeraceae bacterium]
MRFLALFDVLVLDWKNNQVGLQRQSQCEVPASPDQEWVCFRWWDMIEAPADRSNGFVVVDADVSDQSVEVIVDTGSNFDLVIPRSATAREPWTSVLQAQKPIMLHTSTGAHMSRRYTFRGNFVLGGCMFHELQVVDVDDSTLPPGMRLLPIIGTPLLRRFDSVTLDFARRMVGFESCRQGTKTAR